VCKNDDISPLAEKYLKTACKLFSQDYLTDTV
jgi:hypothetical protein